jgi:DNA modification methylase
VPRFKRYPDEVRGIAIGDSWDIFANNSMANERLGYPTQKPEELLTRIIPAGSNEGDVVLDAFCGCGTTVAAAQKLNRHCATLQPPHAHRTISLVRILVEWP